MSKKSFESLGRSVANLTDELRQELSEQVTELRESFDKTCALPISHRI